MRRLCDHSRYYFSLFANKSYTILVTITVALSFLAVIASFGYMLYFTFFYFRLSRIIGGAVSLFSFIYLNKSLQGR